MFCFEFGTRFGVSEFDSGLQLDLFQAVLGYGISMERLEVYFPSKAHFHIKDLFQVSGGSDNPFAIIFFVQ